MSHKIFQLPFLLQVIFLKNVTFNIKTEHNGIKHNTVDTAEAKFPHPPPPPPLGSIVIFKAKGHPQERI
jgi:hypothetical protein